MEDMDTVVKFSAENLIYTRDHVLSQLLLRKSQGFLSSKARTLNGNGEQFAHKQR